MELNTVGRYELKGVVFGDCYAMNYTNWGGDCYDKCDRADWG